MNQSSSSSVPGTCVPSPSISLLLVRRCFTPMFFAALAACTRDPTGTVTPTEHGVPVAVAPAPASPLRADVVELLNELLAALPAGWWYGDEMPRPQTFERLIALGGDALPTLLHLTEAIDDDAIRELLLVACSRLDDGRALPLFVRLLQAKDVQLQSAALAAIVRAGRPQALPALRARLPQVEPSDQIELLEAMLRLGDPSGIGELLRLGFGDARLAYKAADALTWHSPLRRHLGFPRATKTDGYESVGDVALLLPAADEWYREQVLGEASPWRATGEELLQPPFVEAKRAAFDLLQRQIEKENWGSSVLRLQIVESSLAPPDLQRELQVLSSGGHEGGLVMHVWRPDGDVVVGHRFRMSAARVHSRFPADDVVAGYSRVRLPTSAYAELVVGLQTVLSTRLVPWWSGPGSGGSFGSRNFAIGVRGIGASPRRYSGYTTSWNRTDYEPLLAAVAWYDRYVREHGVADDVELDAEAKRLFSACFRAEQPLWDDKWWWVRERMVGMARDAGDVTLLEPLGKYLTPAFRKGQHSEQRTAYAAVNSLAAILGVDRRFGPDGMPLPIDMAAAAYERALADAVQPPR